MLFTLTSKTMKYMITLKEDEIYEEETLDHCLTAIQGILDMDDYEQAYQYLESFVEGIIKQTRKHDEEELIRMLPIREIKATLDVQRAFDDGIYKAKQLIKYYYQNN